MQRSARNKETHGKQLIRQEIKLDTIQNNKKPEVSSLPAFWSCLTEDDISVLREQNKGRRFDPEQVYAVACRCSHGYPQVVVCRPITKKMTPFPTLFWLTCPYLDRKCGELESLHKIHDLEEIMALNPEETSLWHREYAELRMKLIGADTADAIKAGNQSMWSSVKDCGVGGINWRDNPSGVKCLHLQTGTWLGWRSHPAAAALSLIIGETECANNICRGFLPGKEFDGTE